MGVRSGREAMRIDRLTERASLRRASPSADRAFTLVELIVAVAAVALLTVGIGQIFSSVGRLVGSGAAVAETDQFARGVEARLRQDFELLARMRAEDTFIAIRNRRLGDAQRPVYITAEDRDADLRAGMAPYSTGSRAVRVRLDELMFIAPAGRDAHTSQRFPPIGETPGSADYVRVYYGHGLRPAIDARFELQNPDPNSGSNVPPRLWFPDGDFGSRPGEQNIFAPAGAPSGTTVVRGRNELAGNWLLLRQPLLLTGGLVAGYQVAPPGPSRSYWTYTPFIRGLEATERSWSVVGWGTNQPLNDTNNATPTPTNGSPAQAGGPYPRVLYHGRTDLCAQGLTDVRRWLEGLAPTTAAAPTLADLPDATAFSEGRMDDYSAGSGWDASFGDSFPSFKVDAPLWQRRPVALAVDQTLNHIGVCRAIAGCFARFQCDDAPPIVERGDSLGGASGVNRGSNPEPGAVAFMDQHAVIAGRVSHFEVAWSDGKTWLYDTPIDRDGDGVNDLFRGDVLWYDIDFTRYDNPQTTRDLRGVDAANIYGTRAEGPGTQVERTRPEVFPGERRTRLNNAALGLHGRYDWRSTGGDRDPDGANEYLAVFPFRLADLSGGYSLGAYGKPRLIRVRMTVHDTQYRIAGGRRYEFIFPVELK